MRWPWQDKRDLADRAVQEAHQALDRAHDKGGTLHALAQRFERIRMNNNFTNDARDAIQGIIDKHNGGERR